MIYIRQRVYIMGFEDGMIKIGISNMPFRRIKEIETSSGRIVNLIYYTQLCDEKKALSIEKTLHDAFNLYRTRGEYFDFNRRSKTKMEPETAFANIVYGIEKVSEGLQLEPTLGELYRIEWIGDISYIKKTKIYEDIPLEQE